MSEPSKAIMDNDILFASDPNWANDTDGKLWRIEKGKHFHKSLDIWNLETQIEKMSIRNIKSFENQRFIGNMRLETKNEDWKQ